MVSIFLFPSPFLYFFVLSCFFFFRVFSLSASVFLLLSLFLASLALHGTL